MTTDDNAGDRRADPAQQEGASVRHVLVLGGTAEARSLAAALHREPGVRVTSSLAGRVRDPALPEGAVRVGGFGGPQGLADYVRAERVDVLVDATHPFAERISAAAVTAAAARVPLLVLRRPGWTAGPGDAWHRVTSPEAAVEALPRMGQRAFLTTGRGGLSAFAVPDLWFLVRTVDTPEPPLPQRMRLLLDRGPYTVDSERALLREHRIDVLVTKDSGGAHTAAKLTASRELGVPVLVIDRPPQPDAPTVSTVDDALAWIRALHR